MDDYKDGRRLVSFLAKHMSHVLTGSEAAVKGALLANNNINLVVRFESSQQLGSATATQPRPHCCARLDMKIVVAYCSP